MLNLGHAMSLTSKVDQLRVEARRWPALDSPRAIAGLWQSMTGYSLGISQKRLICTSQSPRRTVIIFCSGNHGIRCRPRVEVEKERAGGRVAAGTILRGRMETNSSN